MFTRIWANCWDEFAKTSTTQKLHKTTTTQPSRSPPPQLPPLDQGVPSTLFFSSFSFFWQDISSWTEEPNGCLPLHHQTQRDVVVVVVFSFLLLLVGVVAQRLSAALSLCCRCTLPIFPLKKSPGRWSCFSMQNHTVTSMSTVAIIQMFRYWSLSCNRPMFVQGNNNENNDVGLLLFRKCSTAASDCLTWTAIRTLSPNPKGPSEDWYLRYSDTDAEHVWTGHPPLLSPLSRLFLLVIAVTSVWVMI